MVIAVNEAKADMDSTQKLLKDAQKAFETCAEASTAGEDGCPEQKAARDAVEEEFNFYQEVFYEADAAFQYVNEELRLKQEEA